MEKKDSSWNLIYTMPKREKKVLAELERNNIECFLPIVPEQRQWHDRKKTVDTVLFPSYVFIRTRTQKEYFAISAAHGFCGFVRIGKQIAELPDRTIEQLKKIVDLKLNAQFSTEPFRQGQQVWITEGPLKGMFGEVIKFNHAKKIIVRVEILNRLMLVDYPENILSLRPGPA